MSEFVTLLGAEAVQQAGGRMASAAEEISRSAGYVDNSLRFAIARLDEIVARIPTFSDLVLAAFLHSELNPGSNGTVRDALSELGLPANTCWDPNVHWPRLCALRAAKKAQVALAELGR